MIKRRLLTFALVMATSAGCLIPGRGGVRVGLVYAPRQPPAERVEVISASPGAQYRWIKGHWAFRNNDYEWVPGRWEAPTANYHEWVEGHWAQDRQGWYYVDGHWR